MSSMKNILLYIAQWKKLLAAQAEDAGLSNLQKKRKKKFVKLIAFWFTPYISYSSYKLFVISLKYINVLMCNVDKYLWEQHVFK